MEGELCVWTGSTADGAQLPDGAVLLPTEYQLASGERVRLCAVRPARLAPGGDAPPSELAEMHAEVLQLQRECAALAEELQYARRARRLTRRIESEDAESHEVKGVIEKLHRYNDVKDLAQALIGRLAVMEGCTTRELYPRFDLCLDD